MKRLFRNFMYGLLYDIVNEVIEKELYSAVEVRLRDMEIIKVFDESIIKIQPVVEENLKSFFIEKIRDGKFPKDNKEYWVCIFCGHIDNKDCKYCSGCGAKW